jgi:hypothetical protein
MKRFEFGNPASSNVLIQMVDDHDLAVISSEVRSIKAADDFRLIALRVEDWNRDLSPWKAPAVFGNEDFGDGAKETLSTVLAETRDEAKRYYIGGYSLAGLFALWAAYQTDRFEGVAAASPSIWFPGFVGYMEERPIRTPRVYLSLGDREARTRNPIMATVGDCIRKGCGILRAQGVQCILEWNKGNHFKDPDLRTAAGFTWMLSERQIREDVCHTR